MEVHHPKHTPKNWKGYITEFFMLFAAISLGFLAENYREHYIETERSHELVSSLIKEVENNVSFMDSLIDKDHDFLKIYNQIVFYVIENDEQIDLDSFYTMLPYNTMRYVSNNDIYEQMKSSGSLRYIKDTNLLHMIIAYSNMSKATEIRSSDQEMDFYYNVYTNSINKWMPSRIAAFRHSIFLKRADKELLDDIISRQSENFNKLQQIKKGRSFILTGPALTEFQKEMGPVLSRRLNNIAATMLFMTKTRRAALDLLKFYHQHQSHS
jgi:hypothetical protein